MDSAEHYFIAKRQYYGDPVTTWSDSACYGSIVLSSSSLASLEVQIQPKTVHHFDEATSKKIPVFVTEKSPSSVYVAQKKELKASQHPERNHDSDEKATSTDQKANTTPRRRSSRNNLKPTRACFEPSTAYWT